MRSKSSKTCSRSLSDNTSIAVFTDSTRTEDLAVQSTRSDKKIARAPKYPCKSDGCARRTKRGRLKLITISRSPLHDTHPVAALQPKTPGYRVVGGFTAIPQCSRESEIFRSEAGSGADAEDGAN